METDQRREDAMGTLLTKTESKSETKANKQKCSEKSCSTTSQRMDTDSVSRDPATRTIVASVPRKRGTEPDKNGTNEAKSLKKRNSAPDRSVEGTSSCKVKDGNKHRKECISGGKDRNTTQAEANRSSPEKVEVTKRAPQQTHESDERDEQIFATLYGQCIGDAIGLLTEFMSKKEANYHYGHKAKLEYGDKIEDRHRKRWKVGDWTDDSDQMILIMQSLIGKDGVVDPKDFARRLVHWKENGFKDLGDTCGLDIGHTTYTIISRNDFEQYPHNVSKAVWEESGGYLAPNGGVMRTCILGIHDWWDRNMVYAHAIDICKTTHYDPRCQASAVAVCIAISLMLRRGNRHLKQNGEYIVEMIIEDTFDEASTCLQSKHEREVLLKCLQCKQLSELNLDEENAIGYTYKCLGAGFWALKQNDFRKALQEVVMSGGDADTNAAVAGALLGCKLGNRKHFPETWLELEHKHWLDEQVQKYLTVLKKRQEEWNCHIGKEQTPVNRHKQRETAI